MLYVLQMITTLGAIALISYLLKDQELPENSSNKNQVEKIINRYFVHNHYYYNEGVQEQSQSMNEITYRQIIDWFVQRKHLKTKQIIAFTLKQTQGNQNVILQGFFNIKTEELLEGRKLLGNQIDDELAELHQSKPLVIYE
jgi:hypothetical protein